MKNQHRQYKAIQSPTDALHCQFQCQNRRRSQCLRDVAGLRSPQRNQGVQTVQSGYLALQR